jgi:hypothetical protein
MPSTSDSTHDHPFIDNASKASNDEHHPATQFLCRTELLPGERGLACVGLDDAGFGGGELVGAEDTKLDGPVFSKDGGAEVFGGAHPP